MLQGLFVYLIYFILLVYLIYKNNLLGLFKDEIITSKYYALIFSFKALAVPTFYFVFKKLYGGIDDLDAGKFYHDAQVIHDFALKDFTFYIKLMFGFQNDLPGSYDFEYCLKNTVNWDNGTIKDYLYNDNRVLIRVHSLIDFIAFNSYFAHALISCLFSFIGLQFIYKAFKMYFKGKEILLFLILCFVPALWFFTGGLLKEGITVFCLGAAILQTKKWVTHKSLKNTMLLLLLVFICCLLKPYLLLFSLFGFMVFFMIEFSSKISKKIFIFCLLMFLTVVAVNFISQTFKKRTLLEAALKH